MRYALVTGSTKGIGQAIAIEYLNKGYFTFLNYSKDDQCAGELAANLNHSYNLQYQIIKSDLSDMDGIHVLFDAISNVTNKIDSLVLNVGTTTRCSFAETTEEIYDKILNTNLKIPYFTVVKFLPIISNGGSIVFISSIMGNYPHSVSIPYGISKSAIQFLCKCLVKVVKDRGIRVNCVSPGFTGTEMQVEKNAEWIKRIENKIALGRFADAREIAEVVLNIVSSSYVNGSIVEVYGGYDYQ